MDFKKINTSVASILFNYLRSDNNKYMFNNYLPNVKFIDLMQHSFNHITDNVNYEKLAKSIYYLDESNTKNTIFTADVNFRCLCNNIFIYLIT